MRNWRLGEYLIHELKDGGLWWATWVKFSGCSLSRMGGKAFECHDTLIMSPYKTQEEEERPWEEVEKELQALPKWSRTSYFVKMVDIGGTRLMDCKTLQPASEEDQESIMHQLGFFRSKERSKEDAETLKGLRETFTEFTD